MFGSTLELSTGFELSNNNVGDVRRQNRNGVSRRGR